MNRRTASACLTIACLALASQVEAGPAAADAAAPSATGVTTLRCGTLIDGKSAAPKRDVAIRIEDGRIVSVGAFTPAAAGTVIDRSQDTCLPGLIDAHAHVLIKTDDYQVDHLRRSSGLQGAARPERGAADAAVRVDDGAHPRRRGRVLRASRRAHRDPGRPVRRAAPHRRRSLLLDHGRRRRPQLHRPRARRSWRDGLVVDGVDAVRKAVREEIKHGSDWIKVLASGAMMSAGNDPNKAHFSPEELSAIVDEATRLGVPVAAHAHSAAGIKASILAGVRTIEHGTFIDDEGIRLMKEKGVYLVPTLYVGDYYLNEQPGSEAQAKMNELTRKYRAQHIAAVGKAIKAGVKVGVGTDYVGFPVQAGRARTRAAGRSRHDADAGHPGSHAREFRTARLAGSRRHGRGGQARRHHRGAGRSAAGPRRAREGVVRDARRPAGFLRGLTAGSRQERVCRSTPTHGSTSAQPMSSPPGHCSRCCSGARKSRSPARTASSARSPASATTPVGRWARARSTAITSSAPGTTGSSTAVPARASPATRTIACRRTTCASRTDACWSTARPARSAAACPTRRIRWRGRRSASRVRSACWVSRPRR